MSVELTCPECGAEYDARIAACPVCDPESATLDEEV